MRKYFSTYLSDAFYLLDGGTIAPLLFFHDLLQGVHLFAWPSRPTRVSTSPVDGLSELMHGSVNDTQRLCYVIDRHHEGMNVRVIQPPPAPWIVVVSDRGGISFRELCKGLNHAPPPLDR